MEDTQVLCTGKAMVLPTALRHRAISWYHHYLQHPRASRLEETVCAAMYWAGMRTTILKYVKNCHKCQVHKQHKKQVWQVAHETCDTNPWQALCVDLIGPYTLKGKDKTEFDFMCLTMIDPATSWLEIVELQVVDKPTIPPGTRGHKGI